MYNAFNIPISNVSLLFKTQDLKYLSKRWLPRFILAWIYSRFIKQYNIFFNPHEKTKQQDWYLLNMENKANNIYPALFYALIYGNDQKSRDLFEEHFGKAPDTQDDLNMIIAEINRLNDKLAAISPSKADSKGIEFAKLVAIVETSRTIPIDRSTTLYEFYELYKIEIEKWQQRT